MQTTFILAGNFGVTPFEIMRQDLDEVILVVNYLAESGKTATHGNGSTNSTAKTLTEKEHDKGFWAAL